MAKYKFGSTGIECKVLFEHAGEYIVKFNNGSKASVSKDKVYDLDKLDEGVLDYIKAGAKKVGDAIRTLFLKVKNYVFFKDEKGDVISASSPVNMIQGASECDAVNYYPSNSTAELCKNVGVLPRAIENYIPEGEYEGAIQFAGASVSESVGTGSLIDSLYEDTKDRLKDSEKIKLSGEFIDYNEEEVVNRILNEYDSRCNGTGYNGLPLLIWGAPGIGKTAMLNSIDEKIKEVYNRDIDIVMINGGNVGPDMFTFPAEVKETLDDGEERVTVTDLPKVWLPVYDPTKEDKVSRRRICLANGGYEDKDKHEWVDGPGGIFFIDEFSRMTPAGMNSLMQTPTTREIGGNHTIKLGDRWVIVVAANRKSDMSDSGASDVLEIEAAVKTRFEHVNYVPTPQEWIAWASKPSKVRKNRQNVLPEIVQYIESEIKRDPTNYGDYYEMYKHPSGEMHKEKATACPRTWEAASERLIISALEPKFGKKYDSVSSMPKAEIVKMLTGIVGGNPAERFADFAAQFSLFTPKDAENVWLKGDAAQYEILKQQKLNSSNVRKYFDEHIEPLLKTSYPGGLEDAVSPDAALNAMKFIQLCCYDAGKFNLNSFKAISQKFALDFKIDTRSLTGPYADVAKYKEDVISKFELV